jgi:hypothetical protein
MKQQNKSDDRVEITHRLFSFRLVWAFSVILFILLLQNNVVKGQNTNFCSGNCTSGDIRITSVQLLDISGNILPTNCDDGTPVKVRLKINFNVTSQTRYGFLVTGDVYNNGALTGQLADCTILPYKQGDQSFITTKTFDWTCGEKLELRNVFTAWENSAPSLKTLSICDRLVGEKLTDCAAIRPKCYYYGSESKDAITVLTPISSSIGMTYGNCISSDVTSVSYRSMTFTANGNSGGTPPYSYLWVLSKQGVEVSRSTSNPFEYTPNSSGNITVHLTVKDSSIPIRTYTESSTYSVQTKSSQFTSVSASKAAICPGESSTLSATGGTDGTGAVTKWYTDSQGTQPLSSTTVSPAATTTYYVRREGTCGSTSMQSVTVTVNTASSQFTSVSASKAAICPGESSTLSATGGTDGTGAVTKWYTDLQGTQLLNSTTVSPAATTTYYVRREGTCGSTPMQNVTVTVNEAPSAIETEFLAPTDCMEPTVQMKVKNPSVGTYTLKQSGKETKTFVYEGSGNVIFSGFTLGVGYELDFSNGAGCASSTLVCGNGNIKATSTSALQSIEKPLSDDQLTAYPIPFSQNVTLEFKAERTGKYEINLYDMKGQLIRQLKAGNARAGEITRIEVDGRQMAEGLYLARMVNGAGSKTVKLLKKN